MTSRAVIWSAVCVGVLGTVWLLGGPHRFGPPPDSTQAFSWDTAQYVGTRGNCGPVTQSQIDNDWRPQPGRYLLLLARQENARDRLGLRGRMWLSRIPDSLRAHMRNITHRPGAEPLLYGATDLHLTTALLSAPDSLRSTNPGSPGIVVVRETGRILILLGSLRLEVLQGMGDGFAGTWRSTDPSRALAGYFCGGLIDV